MTKLLAWTIGIVFFPFAALIAVSLYLVWMVLVACAALTVLGLRLLGVGVGLGWLGTAAGVTLYRERRARASSTVEEASAQDIARLRQQVGLNSGEQPGRSVFRESP